MRRVDPDSWVPTGIDDLEDGAWNALRHSGSAIVVAGPGAGKTEFLVQKAAYLLQTADPRHRRRVLAISFKRDAARNLAERFESRFGSHLEDRFVSMTFDAFAKGIVDRFLVGLPQLWRPAPDYSIGFESTGQIRNALWRLKRRHSAELADDPIWDSPPDEFKQSLVGTYRLDSPSESSAASVAVQGWWRHTLDSQQPQVLDFLALNRLAECVIRSNPSLRRALAVTYMHVLVDEFQDTTFAQYDFLESVFRGERGVPVTAVGDRRQRIMGFAGAAPKIFARFKKDFGAEVFELRLNRRSARPLVNLQRLIADRLEPLPTGHDTELGDAENSERAIQAWRVGSLQSECREIANWIVSDIFRSGKRPEDYAIVARRRPDTWVADLSRFLAEAGIRVRDDSAKFGPLSLQDLLGDTLTKLVAALFRFTVGSQNAQHWQFLTEEMVRLRNLDPDNAASSRRAQAEIAQIVQRARDGLKVKPFDRRVATELVFFFISQLDPAALMSVYPAYALHSELETITGAIAEYGGVCADRAKSWALAADEFEALDSVRVMTIHKSKGLEFNVVMLVGLDSYQWSNPFGSDGDDWESLFVAVSRAKGTLITTTSDSRGGMSGVEDVIGILKQSGARFVDLRS